MKLRRTSLRMEQCSLLWFLVATKQPFLLLLVRTTFIPFICPWVMCIMVCDMLIAMQSHSLHSLPFQRVSVSLSIVPFPTIYDLDAASKDYADKADFWKFHRQLFHTSLTCILSSLHKYMTATCITCCADGHYQRLIYGLGLYIADYPEQALLACVVQNWCTKYAPLLQCCSLLIGYSIKMHCPTQQSWWRRWRSSFSYAHRHTSMYQYNSTAGTLGQLWDCRGSSCK